MPIAWMEAVKDRIRWLSRSLEKALQPSPPSDRGPAGTPPPVEQEAFQDRVKPWLLACFGAEIAADRIERNHRFLEEALELVQACGCTASEAHQLVDYTFGRQIGEPSQEVGGVMVTLAALCLAQGLDMHASAETELARIWTKVEKIRAKQAAKPKHSPLPAAPPQADRADAERCLYEHLASGRIYELIGPCILEADHRDGVMYKGADGTVWVRESREFYDGRFRWVPTAAAAEYAARSTQEPKT